MFASKLLWNSSNLEGIRTASTNELLEKASIIHYNFEDRKIYSYLYFGQAIVKKVEDLIRKKLERYNFQEIYLTPIQPHNIWGISGRDKKFNERMLFLKTSSDRDRYVLSPTNEEVSALLAQKLISSYRQLPVAFFQFCDKFRNDPEAKHGIVRTNIFRILESYSFNINEKEMDDTASKFKEAFLEIFNELNLDIKLLEKRKGYLTFIYKSNEEGDTKLLDCNCGTQIYLPSKVSECEKCNIKFDVGKGIELGCIINEGKKYSQKFNAYILDDKHDRIPLHMGTYGLGISRIVYSIVDQHRDEDGINWPPFIEPVTASIIPIDVNNEEQFNYAKNIYTDLKLSNYNVILEDRDKSLGDKIRLYNLVGTPIKIIIGTREFKSRNITIQYRNKKQDIVPLENLNNILRLYEKT